MADDTFPIKSLSDDDVVLTSEAGELRIAKAATQEVPSEVLLGESFAAALVDGRLALVKPAKPTAGQARAGAPVAATLLSSLTGRFVEAERQATESLAALKRQREAYAQARRHTASLVRTATAGAAAAASLVRFAETFLSTSVDDADVDRMTTALRALDAKLGEKLERDELAAILAERDALRDELEATKARRTARQSEMDTLFGGLKEELARASTAIKTLSKDDLAKELRQEPV